MKSETLEKIAQWQRRKELAAFTTIFLISTSVHRSKQIFFFSLCNKQAAYDLYFGKEEHNKINEKYPIEWHLFKKTNLN
jgi:hypothetical protein